MDELDFVKSTLVKMANCFAGFSTCLKDLANIIDEVEGSCDKQEADSFDEVDAAFGEKSKLDDVDELYGLDEEALEAFFSSDDCDEADDILDGQCNCGCEGCFGCIDAIFDEAEDIDDIEDTDDSFFDSLDSLFEDEEEPCSCEVACEACDYYVDCECEKCKKH